MNTLNLNKKSLAELKRAYKKAVTDKKESFTFYGNELLTTYAKYLIEYAETKLK